MEYYSLAAPKKNKQNYSKNEFEKGFFRHSGEEYTALPPPYAWPLKPKLLCFAASSPSSSGARKATQKTTKVVSRRRRSVMLINFFFTGVYGVCGVGKGSDCLLGPGGHLLWDN